VQGKVGCHNREDLAVENGFSPQRHRENKRKEISSRLRDEELE
jgi:hypothetical protein